MARTTFHLVPVETWASSDAAQPWAPASLASEGFIHCTDGADAMIATANRHYRDDPRHFLVLTIDLDATGSPWRFDDQAGIYPHVYGPIARLAILGAEPILRAADGRFVSFSA